MHHVLTYITIINIILHGVVIFTFYATSETSIEFYIAQDVIQNCNSYKTIIATKTKRLILNRNILLNYFDFIRPKSPYRF